MCYKSLEHRISKLESMIKKSAKYEGGAAGHMKHIYDYTDLTLRDIKGIIRNLFSGKIEDVTEKLDGMNIQCTMNNNGNVVFIRNKGDLNSATGGMSVNDMADKWAGKEHIANTYLNAADVITKVFNKIGKKFFNPNANTKIVANCECISEGKTNIIMYAKAQVYFHNLWIYTREDKDSKWEKSEVTTDGLSVLNKACSDIDGAQLTPKVIIKVTDKSNDLLTKYIKEIDSIFKDSGCSEKDTIDDYRYQRFCDLCDAKYKWITSDEKGMDALFDRWFNDDKSTKLTVLKKIYKDYLDELTNISEKSVVYECMKPLDKFFSSLGNSIISLCDNIVNAGIENEVVEDLSNDLEVVVNQIRSSGSDEVKDKLIMQLGRLSELGNQINATEGIVFRYGDKLMKCTGSFASINQIMNLKYSM